MSDLAEGSRRGPRLRAREGSRVPSLVGAGSQPGPPASGPPCGLVSSAWWALSSQGGRDLLRVLTSCEPERGGAPARLTSLLTARRVVPSARSAGASTIAPPQELS